MIEVCCTGTDAFYPMKADIYYPIITQNSYGQPSKEWVYDRTVACNATTVGGTGTEELKPEVFLQYKDKLVARSKIDLRISSNDASNAISNILVKSVVSSMHMKKISRI